MSWLILLQFSLVGCTLVGYDPLAQGILGGDDGGDPTGGRKVISPDAGGSGGVMTSAGVTMLSSGGTITGGDEGDAMMAMGGGDSDAMVPMGGGEPLDSSMPETGGLPGGGTVTGGEATGGMGTGGEATGGMGTGGEATGGMGTGGDATGGMTTGGEATGGMTTGGLSTGGDATGGMVTGGDATGGMVTGGDVTGGVSGTGGTPVTYNSILHRYEFADTGLQVTDSVGDAEGVLHDDTAMSGLGYVSLDGVDDYVTLPGGLVASLNGFTIMAWAVWGGGGCDQTLFSFGQHTGDPEMQGPLVKAMGAGPYGCDGFLFAGYGAGAVFSTGSNSVANDSVYKSSTMRNGSRSFIAITVDRIAGRWRFYMDGLSPETILFVGPTDNRAIPAVATGWQDISNWIGRDQSGASKHFRGRIEEFRIYGRSLSFAEVESARSSGPDVLYDP